MLLQAGCHSSAAIAVGQGCVLVWAVRWPGIPGQQRTAGTQPLTHLVDVSHREPDTTSPLLGRLAAHTLAASAICCRHTTHFQGIRQLHTMAQASMAVKERVGGRQA
jgi:hypothetical protein